VKLNDLLVLILLAVIWGAAFLLIRVAAPEFGAVGLIEVRIGAALLVLLPLALLRGAAREILRHWRPLAILGVFHHALPYGLFAYAMLTLTGGFSAIVNATSPLFAGAVAWAWLGERPAYARVFGMLLGLAGVTVLVGDIGSLGAGAATRAVAAALGGAFCYGFAAVQARKQLAGVSPLATATGSMLAAAIVMLPGAVILWPDSLPSAPAWSMAIVLGVVCTAIAFVLYVRLIGSAGPTRAITVTFLIPVFAVVFGVIFIEEPVSMSMLAGGAVILVGTALSTGALDATRLRKALGGRGTGRRAGAPRSGVFRRWLRARRGPGRVYGSYACPAVDPAESRRRAATQQA
jgi:drug/metabolite transporter (DMT)-like permease